MADLYGHLIETKTLDTLVRPAINDKEELYFPARLTREFLAEMRADQGSYIYSCQYMLDPVSPDDAMFGKEHLNYIEDLATPQIITDTYITVDPAISQNEKADYSVIMTVGMDKAKRRYVLDYVREHLTPYQLIDRIFAVAESATNLRKVGIETVAFQKMLIYAMKDEMRRRNKYLNIVELKADKDKIRRARMLQPAWENDDIFIHRYHTDLRRELTEFPFSEHDDTVDALAYVEQLLKPLPSLRSRMEYIYKAGNSKTNY